MLGSRYALGLGVTKDEVAAVAWWSKAAAQGHAGAQYALGSAYQAGLGIERDPVEAAYWYRLAAAQGSSAAQDALRRMSPR